MTDDEIAVKLTVLEQEAKSAKHRLDDGGARETGSGY